MGTSSSFTDVMARLRAGDEDAARQVFQRFVHRLVGLARVRLGRDLRRRVDPEDVVQSAYKSFFLRYEEGKVEVRDWGSSAPAPLPSEVVGRPEPDFLRGCGLRQVQHTQATIPGSDKSVAVVYHEIANVALNPACPQLPGIPGIGNVDDTQTTVPSREIGMIADDRDTERPRSPGLCGLSHHVQKDLSRPLFGPCRFVLREYRRGHTCAHEHCRTQEGGHRFSGP